MDLGFQLAAILVGVVALGCGAVAVASYRAMVRVGNPRLRWVALAFLLLALKNVVKGVNLAAGAQAESGALEVAFSAVDLAAVGLIVWPLLSRRGA